MGLKNLTKNIYFLPHEPEVDRPMLAYVKGDKFSLAVDAGYSKKHVQDFYRALRSCDLKEPDFTVITHWHYDHTFGLHDISGVSIAHPKTNLFLREQQDRANDKKYICLLYTSPLTMGTPAPARRRFLSRSAASGSAGQFCRWTGRWKRRFSGIRT